MGGGLHRLPPHAALREAVAYTPDHVSSDSDAGMPRRRDAVVPEAGPLHSGNSRNTCVIWCNQTRLDQTQPEVWNMKRTILLLLFVAVSLPSLAQVTRPSVYIEPQNGFETYVAAAIAKKQVPVDVVADPTKATYTLKAAPVEIKQESTGGKIARCLFAYCAGIEDKGNVSVQLIESNSSKMLWAYSVNKQRGGSKNQQSMAEAVAKHLKEFLSQK